MSTQKEARTINIRANTNTVHRIIWGITSQPDSSQTNEITPEAKGFYFQLHVGRPTILP